MSGGRKAPGFTLLEVIVAVTILGGGILALLSMFSGSLRLSGGARDVSAASIYASQRLEEALLSPAPASGVESGEFGGKYRWVTRTTFLPPEDDRPFEGIRFDVTVEWDGGGSGRSVELSATRWDAKEGGPGA